MRAKEKEEEENIHCRTEEKRSFFKEFKERKVHSDAY